MEILRARLGGDQAQTVEALLKLGDVARKQNRYDEARGLIGEAVAARRRTRGNDHLDTAAAERGDRPVE